MKIWWIQEKYPGIFMLDGKYHPIAFGKSESANEGQWLDIRSL